MQDETQDILAERTMPMIREKPGRWSGLSSIVKAAFIIACLLVVYVLVIRAWEYVLRWRERSYKLSMRRKHGIPDYDHRPFNVAYADVVQSRREKKDPLKSRVRPAPPASADDRVRMLSEQNVRQRAGGQSSTPAIPGTYNSFMDNAFASTSGATANGNYSSRLPTIPQSPSGYYPRTTPAQPPTFVSDVSPQKAGPSRRFSRKNLSIGGDVDGKKRSIDDQEFDEHDAKKPKVDGDDLIDGDEDAEWEDRRSDGPRGSKRGLGEEEENNEEVQSKRTRDKRPRKVSLEKPSPMYQDMDVDIDGEEEDDVAELKHSSRGKKRDRAEAGSTFGGDDGESAPELDEDDLKALRRRRKRRTVSKRKSDAGSIARGKKRDRDTEDVGSDLENDDELVHKSSRKKRGKRTSQVSYQEDEDRREGSDISLDESLASTKSRARQIGDEWESNGIKYKIGLNGQRLRQALVKKARHKFVMPKDSQHPDRNENLEVFVETWLTEEEYEDAKSHHLLAWQDSPKQSAEPEHLSLDTKQVPQTPAPGGKNLLWGSTPSTPVGSPVSHSPSLDSPAGVPPGRQLALRGDPYRQSIAGNVGLRINPFEQPQRVTTRRIASAARAMIMSGAAPSAGLSDSTNGSPRTYRTFSKWEKQDLEAKAMMKMREANKKKEAEKEKEAKLKEEREKAEREKAEKERVERERAERERKEKEAQAVAKLASVKPPDAQPAQDQTKNVLSFSFTKPASIEPTKTADATKPSLFNAPPLGASPFGSTSTKPDDKAAKSLTFPPPVQPSTSSLFGKPATTPAQFTPNPFGALAPSATSADKKEQPKAGSALGLPSSSSAPGAASSSTATKPMFSFPPPNTPQALGSEQKKAEQAASSSGSSLLARLGAPNPFDQSKTTSAPSQSQSTSGFSFGKPDAPKTSAPAAGSGALQGTSSQLAPSAPATTSAPSSGLKFNFGPVGKSSGPAPSQLAPASSSLNGALGVDASKSTTTAPSSFSFNKPAPPIEAKKDENAGITTAKMTPKFSFGGPSSGSAFGAPSSGSAFGAPSSGSAFGGPSSGSAFGAPSSGGSAFGTSSGSAFSSKPPAPASGAQFTDSASKPAASVFGGTAPGAAAPSTDESAKSGFSFGSTGGSGSPFSVAAQSKEPAKSAFSGFGNAAGNTQTTSSPFGSSNAFGGGGVSSAFGGASSNKPAEASKSPFSFGTSAASSPAPGGGNNAETPKSGFPFGGNNAPTTTPATTPAASGGPSGFSFSTTPQASPFSASTTPGQSIFGKPSSGPSAFGFGSSSNTNTTTTPGSGFSFGNPPTGQQQQ